MPVFSNSTGAALNSSNLVDLKVSGNVANVRSDTRKGEGVRLLRSYVQYEAIHDSAPRGGFGCHPGTREQYIRSITSWGNGEWGSDKRAFLMTGPAGAGKSAIARTCARQLRASGNLGASFFFYRPSGWNKPRTVIPTIVHQLTTRDPAYCDYIDALILNDSLVLEKAMDIQFLELLVKPLQKLSADGHSVGKDIVIIIDGLDECATVGAQMQIIHLIMASIREQTTPFIWAFFSRPEPPITSAFFSQHLTNIWTLPLTLSSNANSDIEAYLRGSFEVIRAKHSIPAGEWPSEVDIRRLVSRSAGLFVYSVTAIQYVDGLGKGTSDPQERLRALLERDPDSTDSRFSALDQLYGLVMAHIPQWVLSSTLSLLYLHYFLPTIFHSCRAYADVKALRLSRCCFALGISSAVFQATISNLHSVLEVTWSENQKLTDLQFYHRSFQEFLTDSRRSNQYCIESPAVYQHCLEMIVRTLSNNSECTHLEKYDGFRFTLQAFFTLVWERDWKLSENVLLQLSQLDWSNFHPLVVWYYLDFRKFIRKIPKEWRPSIVRPYCGGLSGNLRQIRIILMPERYEAEAYILGQGDKRGFLVKYESRTYVFSINLSR